MKKHFTVKSENEIIQVARSNKNIYNLKYPDFKYLELERNEHGWVVEDRSGDYWSDEDIEAIGTLIAESEPPVEEDEEADSALTDEE